MGKCSHPAWGGTHSTASSTNYRKLAKLPTIHCIDFITTIRLSSGYMMVKCTSMVEISINMIFSLRAHIYIWCVHFNNMLKYNIHAQELVFKYRQRGCYQFILTFPINGKMLRPSLGWCHPTASSTTCRKLAKLPTIQCLDFIPNIRWSTAFIMVKCTSMIMYQY